MPIQYTDEQKRAIYHRNGNLLILACAGSGKTEVISHRIAKLVSEGTEKQAIIAFTFTERAAGELKSRIRRKLEEICPADPSLGDMYVGTIHSFCLQLLKEIDPNYRKFEVMDEARQTALIMTRYFSNGIGLNLLQKRTRTKRYWDTVRTFQTTLNVLHQKAIEPLQISQRDSVLADCIANYRRIAYGPPNYFFDFNGIIDALIRALKANPTTLPNVRARFKHLVVDEYQDVDDRQEELIRLISADGQQVMLTAVGDDDQAIYGWRGARLHNILNFRNHYPQVTTITLDRNFRSTHAIVEVANSAIRKIPSQNRSPKAMVAWQWNGSQFAETLAEPGDIQLRVFGSEQEEAEWIANRVIQLRGTTIRERDGSTRNMDWGDMAILIRSVRRAGREIAGVLRATGIPTVVKGIGGLFDHDEVLIVYASFCLLARSDFWYDYGDGPQPHDETATRMFIRERIRTIRAQQSLECADENQFLEWIALKREELDRRNLEKAVRGRLARRIYPQDIFQEILAALGTGQGEQPWPSEGLYHLGRLSALITQFEAVHQWVTPRDLKALCLFLGGWAAGEVDEGGTDEKTALNAVQIMTVHAAKGLEWPVVFLPRISSGNFPSQFRSRGPETFLDPSIFDAASYASGDDGERRLWYVALTRCRKFLHVTSLDRPRKRPSIFYTGIKHDYVQRMEPIADRPKGIPTPPADAELLPTTYSDLNYFWRCAFEYQLRALMGFGPGVKESYGYGQQIHNVLAEVHKRTKEGDILTDDEVAALVDQRFHLRYTSDGNDPNHRPLTRLREAAKLSLKNYLNAYGDKTRLVLHAEKPFEFVDADSGALISGTIDLLERIETDSQEEARIPVAVVDFKTHSFRDRESYERAREGVEKQLRLYAIAAKKALNFDAGEARAHFLSPLQKEVRVDSTGRPMEDRFSIDISEKRLEEVHRDVRNAVLDIRESVKTQSFALSGCMTGHCKVCDYRKFCPGFAQWKARNRDTPRPPSPEQERIDEILMISEDVDAGNAPK